MNENSCLVSAVIPAYNARDYIAEAIESALAQTYAPIEVIVVDDGSTDGTEEAVRPFGDQVRYIKKENGGPASARNLGIQSSRGEYVAFLDADDIWLPEKTERQVEVMKDNPELGLVCAGSYVVDKDNNVITEWHMPEDREETFKSVYDRNFILCLTVMIRRECFDKVGLLDTNLEISQDVDMWLRILKHYPFRYVNELFARYRVHADNISKNIDKRYAENIVVISKPEVSGDLGFLTRLVRMGKCHYYFADIFLKTRYCFTAALTYAKAVLICPWIGAYYHPAECNKFRFSLPYRILKVYWLVLFSLYRGIKQSAGFKIPEYDLHRRVWTN